MVVTAPESIRLRVKPIGVDEVPDDRLWVAALGRPCGALRLNARLPPDTLSEIGLLEPMCR